VRVVSSFVDVGFAIAGTFAGRVSDVGQESLVYALSLV
jgi:hypothetical protein